MTANRAIGAAIFAAGTLLAFTVSCNAILGINQLSGGGGDGTNEGGPPTSDSSLDDSDTYAAPPSPVLPANLILLHAAPGVGPVRLCIATQTGSAAASVAPIFAFPDSSDSAPPWHLPPAFGPAYDGGVGAVTPGTPGLYPGVTTAIPEIPSLIQSTSITPYLIDANVIAAYTADTSTYGGEPTCVALIGQNAGGGILATSQFTALAPISTILVHARHNLAPFGAGLRVRLSALRRR